MPLPRGAEPGAAAADPDAGLVEGLLRREETAFRELVSRHHARVFRLVHGILGDWQQAEDTCQDIYLSVYRKLGSFRYRSKFSTWLYRVSVNAALKSRRRVARRPLPLDVDEFDHLAGADDERVTATEGDEVFRKLLRPLPPHLRTVVVLREREGLSYREIAAVLECTPGAVEQRLHRAFVQLRDIWLERPHDLGLDS